MIDKLPGVLDRLKGVAGSDPDLNLVDAVRDVFVRHGVRYAFLFGSRARAGVDRDYDVAVVFERKPSSALELGLLVADLAEALGVHEDLIDLVDLDSAPLSLARTVIDEGRILWGGDEALDYLCGAGT
jgi:predicted nucleotidyltransferase